jgi:hypothetical protein
MTQLLDLFLHLVSTLTAVYGAGHAYFYFVSCHTGLIITHFFRVINSIRSGLLASKVRSTSGCYAFLLFAVLGHG